MKVLQHNVETVTSHSIKFKLDDGRAVWYKEWINDSGCVIDSQIIDENGDQLDELNDNVIIEAIQKEADSIIN